MIGKKLFCYKYSLLLGATIIVFVSYTAFSQAGKVISINGSILDENSREGIPYASIGVVNTEIGTMTDSTGYFNLLFYEENVTDTVRISSMGFKDTLISLKDFKQIESNNILLEKAYISLGGVTVSSSLPKKAILGKLKYRSTVAAHLIPLNQTPIPEKMLLSRIKGREIGQLFKLPKRIKVAKIKSLIFILHQRGFKYIVIRVNAYSVKDTLHNLIKDFKPLTLYPKDNGEFSIDLSTIDLNIDDDFIVSLELLDFMLGFGNSKLVSIPSSLSLGKNALYKKGAQNNWEKMNLNLSFQTEIFY